jgi:hypothetical protein
LKPQTRSDSEEFHGFKVNGTVPLPYRGGAGAGKTAEIRHDQPFSPPDESFAQHPKFFARTADRPETGHFF